MFRNFLKHVNEHASNTNFQYGLFSILFVIGFLVIANFNVHNRYGDAQSLTNVMVNGDLLNKEGLTEKAIVPRIPRLKPESCCDIVYYSGFPPIVNWMGGMLATDFENSLAKYRIVSGIFALLTLLLFVASIRLSFNHNTALLAGIVMLATMSFWSTFVTQIYNLSDIFLWMSVFLILKAQSDNISPSKTKLFCLFFLASMTSYEYLAFGTVFVFVYSFAYWKEQCIKLVASVFMACISGILLKIFLSAWQKGNVLDALNAAFFKVVVA